VTTLVATAVFFTGSIFFCFFWGVYWKSGFFWLWSNFRNVCCIIDRIYCLTEYIAAAMPDLFCPNYCSQVTFTLVC